jgi:hypothetical protein
MRPLQWKFWTTCVESDGPSINDMQRAAKSVSYSTLRRVLGDELVKVEKKLGYDTGRSKETGLRMKNDWAVSCFKSMYRGMPCYYFVWSHIEHIFVQGREVWGTRNKEEGHGHV